MRALLSLLMLTACATEPSMLERELPPVPEIPGLEVWRIRTKANTGSAPLWYGIQGGAR